MSERRRGNAISNIRALSLLRKTGQKQGAVENSTRKPPRQQFPWRIPDNRNRVAPRPEGDKAGRQLVQASVQRIEINAESGALPSTIATTAAAAR